MKYYLLLVISLLILASCENKQSLQNNQSDFSRKYPLSVPVENSLVAHWAKKEVKDSLLIDDMEGKHHWKVKGIATLNYTEERSIDGKNALRYQTRLRDTAHLMLPENRTSWGSFGGQQGGGAHFGITFDEPQDWSEYNRISIWVYIHPTANPMHHFFLEIINEGTDYNTISPRKDNVVQDLEAGRWHQVHWEIPHLERNKVKHFNIFHTLIGYNPEGEDLAIFDFDRLQLQKIDADNYEGWTVPAEKFSFSHVGYRPQDPKIALIGETDQNGFQLIDQNNKEAYKGAIEVIKNKNGVFYQLDFSNFQKEGVYRLKCGASESKPFPIKNDVWLEPLFSAINFYYCQRCGFDVPGIHGVCHMDWQGIHGEEKKVINGGWHDAGDLSQGYYRTAIGTYVLMRNLEQIQPDKTLAPLARKLQDEAAWGLQWLLKTRFADGNHISWARMRIYTDNKIGTIDDVVIPTQNVPWENFLGAAVECKASQLLKDVYPELSTEARTTAVEDWQATIASREIWDQATYQEASWGAVSSILLFKMTGDAKYQEYAVRFGNLLLQCQEQLFQKGIPITGYFFTNTTREKIIHNNHGAFDEAPMLALKELCMAFPDHENWINWYSSAVIYSEYFIKRGSEIAAPYYLVPNSVFRKSDILADENKYRRKYSLLQYNDGTALNDEYTLRTFPIWNGELFHGGTSTHLSTSWALAEASLLRNDLEGMQLVGKQLEWTLGSNPFGQSLMYGVGYNFAPQFAYCTKNVVGSLAVGMDCMHNDEPYWHASNYATSKEMWIAPVNRFVGTVAAYTEGITHPERKTTGDIQIEVEKIPSGSQAQKVILTIKGTDNHQLEIKTFNAVSNLTKQSVFLTSGKAEQIELDLTLVDKEKPYVVVINVDNDPLLRQEIVGSYDPKIQIIN